MNESGALVPRAFPSKRHFVSEWLNAFKLFTDKKCQGRWRLYLRYARVCCKLAVDVLIKSSVYIPVISAVPPASLCFIFMFHVFRLRARKPDMKMSFVETKQLKCTTGSS